MPKKKKISVLNLFLAKIVVALQKIRLNVEFSGRNDILLEGKKISGNAFMQNQNGMVTHEHFYNCDFQTMINTITPNDQKLISKGIASVRSRVTNLKGYLPDMSQEKLMQYLTEALTGLKLMYLSDQEIKSIEKDSLSIYFQ
ncbi:biotin/lipoate A/B protein ligase family protein [Areca yellow leaf disease phytoplasma]|uniref:lipoate--protein ligase family protein n=1 Tax=Areca yellow leaf disease phytoplasma TaxID=927614 RepID=UPI0035B550F2